MKDFENLTNKNLDKMIDKVISIKKILEKANKVKTNYERLELMSKNESYCKIVRMLGILFNEEDYRLKHGFKFEELPY